MMLELVTVDDAREQLRLDSSDNDPWVHIAIQGVSEAVRAWLKDDWRLYLPARDSSGAVIVDSAGDPVPAEDSGGPIVHPCVRLAVLAELESHFRFRSGDASTEVPSHAGYGYSLGRAATNLLTGLRRPTSA